MAITEEFSYAPVNYHAKIPPSADKQNMFVSETAKALIEAAEKHRIHLHMKADYQVSSENGDVSRRIMSSTLNDSENRIEILFRNANNKDFSFIDMQMTAKAAVPEQIYADLEKILYTSQSRYADDFL